MSPRPVHPRARRSSSAWIALATAVAATSAFLIGAENGDERAIYRPSLAVSDAVKPFLENLDPGSDAFVEEKTAEALKLRLQDLAAAMRSGVPDLDAGLAELLAPDFRGARPVNGVRAATTGSAPVEVRRAAQLETDLTLDSRAFAAEVRRLREEMREGLVAEFLITSIDAQAADRVLTEVRYDIVGTGVQVWRVEHVGVWSITWRPVADSWRIAEWAPRSHTASRAGAPVFSEVTTEALGSNESFARQLRTGLDAWMTTLDSVLTRDSNGHHGVSVGDADGDGLEDLYVAQPAGLPNRLYRARGDSTFEDITERSGVGILDDTAQTLFADVENDGDQDLVLATGTRPLLFLNDGTGRFSAVPDAFSFEQQLQGSLTSIAMADYDRDGFLDLYLCVYSYFYGAGEDKAGTPMPYYDARNGPPAVLFRNDGRGRFVDVTREAGLEEGNDRYHFAATWGDFDNDGWPDLLVANDFGTKNLYRNLGRKDGRVTFRDVAAEAGVLDHGAGMSAAFVDYDNDGLLDIYTGNMWTDSGLRVTSSPAFMPDAPPDVRALYRRHARGNSLFHNLGNGRFEDRSLEAGVDMGRWAWSSDALDFDSDGWEDLYVVNGMLTKKPLKRGREGFSYTTEREKPSRPLFSEDLESFFWRQVVARSPVTRVTGTQYDEAWRAINQLLFHRSIASHQRNVFFRNDGHGGFDEISGATGLDLEQDGRAFAAFDMDRDGDPDLAIMAARQAPQLRVFRNDVQPRAASVTLRLAGSASNRDAVGARVTIETDRLRRTKYVRSGSGFLSQHSLELHVGLGPSRHIRALTVEWPSGQRQVFTDVPLNHRLQLVEGGMVQSAPFKQPPAVDPTAARTHTSTPAPALPDATWLYEPFPAPEFSLVDVHGKTQSLSSFRGRPTVLLFWSPAVRGSREALTALGAGYGQLTAAGIGTLAIAVDAGPESVQLKQLPANLPVAIATREVALSFAIVHRHVYMNRQDLVLPSVILVDAAGLIVKMYRGPVRAATIVEDATHIDVAPEGRVARAVPFPGRFHTPLPRRNYLPYGRELLDQGLETAAVAAFERAAAAQPSPSTLYRLGTLLVKSGEPARARTAFERALALQPDLAEANNDVGTLLAQDGDLNGAIARFRAALAATPEYPDALNNLGYALLLTGQDQEARSLYEKALALQPDFPEALNNLGLLFGRGGDLDKAERYFRDALGRRETYGEAANNLALVLVARGQAQDATRLLEEFIAKAPEFEAAYITLAKIHLGANRVREGLTVLERLLQHNPTHPAALELVRNWKPAR